MVSGKLLIHICKARNQQSLEKQYLKLPNWQVTIYDLKLEIWSYYWLRDDEGWTITKYVTLRWKQKICLSLFFGEQLSCWKRCVYMIQFLFNNSICNSLDGHHYVWPASQFHMLCKCVTLKDWDSKVKKGLGRIFGKG